MQTQFTEENQNAFRIANLSTLLLTLLMVYVHSTSVHLLCDVRLCPTLEAHVTDAHPFTIVQLANGHKL